MADKRVREELSHFLLPEEKWQKNEKYKTCQDCGYKFGLFKRRHHCRKCGKIFCSKCSNDFIDGVYFQRKGKQRFCNECYRRTLDLLRELNINIDSNNNIKIKKKSSASIEGDNTNDYSTPYSSSLSPEKKPQQQHEKFRKSDEKQHAYDHSDDHSPSSEEDHMPSIRHIDSKKISNQQQEQQQCQLQVQQIHLKDLQQIVFAKIEKLSTYMCKKHDIALEWQNTIQDFVQKAIQDIKIDSTYNDEDQDICSFVKIKKIFNNKELHIPDNGYVKGIICRKNLVSRKMKSSFENPKILIIKNSIEYFNQIKEVYDSYENLLKNERKYLRKVVDKIASLQPDIVFVQDKVNKFAQDLFTQKGISLVNQLKPRILKKIAKTTRARQIGNLEELEQYQKDKILGTCKKINFQAFPDFGKYKDPTLMFLESENTYGGVSLCISGGSQKELSSIKKFLKDLLRISKFLWLEINMIYINNQLVKTQVPNKVPEIYSHGNFSLFLDQYMSFEDFINKDSITFTKLNLMRANVNNFIDISSKEELETYIKQRKEHFNTSKVSFFSEQCETINKTIEFNCSQTKNTQDTTLGKYILLKVGNLDHICEVCRRPRYNHIGVYYRNDTYLKISVQSKFGLHNSEEYETTNNQIQLKNQIGDSESKITQKNVSQILKKKQKIDIYTYLECDHCQQKLTDSIKLKRAQQEYSFGRFLCYMLSTYQLHNYEDYSEQLQKIPTDSKQCPHYYKQRVFKHQDKMVKFIAKKFSNFSLALFDVFSRDVQSRVKSSDKQYFITVYNQFKKDYDPIIQNFKKLVQRHIEQLKKNYKEQDIQQKLMELKNLLEELQSFYQQNRVYLQRLTNFMDLAGAIHRIYQKLKSYWEQYSVNLDDLQKQKESKSTIQGISILMGVQVNEDYNKKKYRNSTIGTQKLMASSSLKVDDQVSPHQERKSRHAEKRFSVNPFSSSGKHSSKQIEEGSDSLKKLALFQKNNNNNNNDITQSVIVPNGQNNNHHIEENASAFIGSRQNAHNSVQSSAQQDQSSQNNKYTFKDKKRQIDEILTKIGQKNLNADDTYHEGMKYKVIPVYEDQVMSYVAWALNSGHYLKDIYQKENFTDFEYVFENKSHSSSKEPSQQYQQGLQGVGYTDFVEDKPFQEFIKAKLHPIQSTNSHGSDGKRLVIPILQKQKMLKKQNSVVVNLKEEILELESEDLHQSSVPHSITSRQDALSRQSFGPSSHQSQIAMGGHGHIFGVNPKGKSHGEVIMYYPAEFEALRMCHNIPLSRFIMSALSCMDYEAKGGKQNADFFKSAEDLIIVKGINDKEFQHLKNIAFSYFNHMWQNRYEAKPSLLAKIYGMFEVKTSSSRGPQYLLVMENLYFGINPKEPYISVYDLKGSESNRFLKNEKEPTLLDTNFRIDRNAEPIPLYGECFNIIDRALHSDCKFLLNHKVVDYSLLLIINNQDKTLKMGIIDYLRLYDFWSEIETFYKRTKNNGVAPTIVKPDIYKSRFLNSMTKKYFVHIESSVHYDKKKKQKKVGFSTMQGTPSNCSINYCNTEATLTDQIKNENIDNLESFFQVQKLHQQNQVNQSRKASYARKNSRLSKQKSMTVLTKQQEISDLTNSVLSLNIEEKLRQKGLKKNHNNNKTGLQSPISPKENVNQKADSGENLDYLVLQKMNKSDIVGSQFEPLQQSDLPSLIQKSSIEPQKSNNEIVMEIEEQQLEKEESKEKEECKKEIEFNTKLQDIQENVIEENQENEMDSQSDIKSCQTFQSEKGSKDISKVKENTNNHTNGVKSCQVCEESTKEEESNIESDIITDRVKESNSNSNFESCSNSNFNFNSNSGLNTQNSQNSLKEEKKDEVKSQQNLQGGNGYYNLDQDIEEQQKQFEQKSQ